jgi:GntR family transcriptional repressor for pyruvate dehydrogenase complex
VTDPEPIVLEPAPSKTEQVVAVLLERAARGSLPSGFQLPQEGVLAAQLGISRLTLREAMRTLQNLGVLRVERGRGTFVTERSEWARMDPTVLGALLEAGEGRDVLKELTELRRIVETGAARLAATRHSEDDIGALSDALAEMEHAAHAQDVVAFAAADVAFHDVVLAAAGNTLVSNLFESMHSAMQRIREETTRLTIGSLEAVEVHRTVLEGIRSGDPAAATRAMSAHFDNTDRFVDEAIRADEGARSRD